MLSLTDSFTVLRLSENFAPPNLSDYLRASAAASIFFFPASCLAMSLQVQPAGGLNTRVTLCLFGLCASRINPAHFRVLVGLSGLEPPTSRLSGVRSNRLSYKPIVPDSVLTPSPCGGDKRDRTVDLLLAKQALSQLSYTPISGVFTQVFYLRFSHSLLSRFLISNLSILQGP